MTAPSGAPAALVPLFAAEWRASQLVPSTANPAFDWVATIYLRPDHTRGSLIVAAIRQSGARPSAQAQALVTAVARIPAMLRVLVAVEHIFAMSDPDHPAFADSAADCLDALLEERAAVRAILTGLIPARANDAA